MSVLLGACAVLIGTLMYQFTVGKNIGGPVHPARGDPSCRDLLEARKRQRHTASSNTFQTYR
jgi:hypothetical protein